mmetsp:Transcript_2202/g.5168  ORF Transcript_2202/g.5168 Transcript_2202/m.5168 type:complete len:263 (+) Transcript_2202:1039-1827(+)
MEPLPQRRLSEEHALADGEHILHGLEKLRSVAAGAALGLEKAKVLPEEHRAPGLEAELERDPLHCLRVDCALCSVGSAPQRLSEVVSHSSDTRHVGCHAVRLQELRSDHAVSLPLVETRLPVHAVVGRHDPKRPACVLPERLPEGDARAHGVGGVGHVQLLVNLDVVADNLVRRPGKGPQLDDVPMLLPLLEGLVVPPWAAGEVSHHADQGISLRPRQLAHRPGSLQRGLVRRKGWGLGLDGDPSCMLDGALLPRSRHGGAG